MTAVRMSSLWLSSTMSNQASTSSSVPLVAASAPTHGDRRQAASAVRHERERQTEVEAGPDDVPAVGRVVGPQRRAEPDGPRDKADPHRRVDDDDPHPQCSQTVSHRAYTVAEMLTVDFEAVPAVGNRARTPGLIVMKFGGSSVGDTDKLKRVAQRLAAARESGAKVVAVLSAMGDTTDELIRLAYEVSPRPQPARVRHAHLDRRADLERALRDGDPRPRPRGGLVHRVAGRHRHRRVAHQGEDRRGSRRADPRRAGGGQDRARRRLPGRVDRDARRDDARPRRLRHDRGRAGGRTRRRRLRDLHRRARRVHGRSADRARRAEARLGDLRGDARDVGLGREGDGSALDRGGAKLRCQTPRSLDVRGRRGNLDRRGGRGNAGEGDHLRGHARHVRGEGRDPRRTRPAGRRRARFPRARRRRREHRHDRAERLGGRRDEHHVHAAEDRPAGRRRRSSTRPRR